MGKNSPSGARDWHPRMRHKFVKTTIALFLGISVYLPAIGASPGENPVHKTAQQYIAQFRSGTKFREGDSVTGLVIGGRIDKANLSMLIKELAQGSSEVRENVVHLLEQVGLALDRPRPDQFAVIRNHDIIRAMIVEGFSKPDGARTAAARALRYRCMPSDLAAFNDLYLKSLAQFKGDYVYLAAKAKTTQARPYIDHMATMPAFRAEASIFNIIRTAQAALGNTGVEDEFINAVHDAQKNAPPAPKNRFYDEGPARDGTELAARFEPLGLIGTRRSLLVACSYLRSPLKSYVPGVSETTIRFAALEAIGYNFPDARVLLEPRDLGEWAAAERFCTEHFGAVFDGPTPNIPPHNIFPTKVIAP